MSGNLLRCMYFERELILGTSKQSQELESRKLKKEDKNWKQSSKLGGKSNDSHHCEPYRALNSLICSLTGMPTHQTFSHLFLPMRNYLIRVHHQQLLPFHSVGEKKSKLNHLSTKILGYNRDHRDQVIGYFSIQYTWAPQNCREKNTLTDNACEIYRNQWGPIKVTWWGIKTSPLFTPSCQPGLNTTNPCCLILIDFSKLGVYFLACHLIRAFSKYSAACSTESLNN